MPATLMSAKRIDAALLEVAEVVALDVLLVLEYIDEILPTRSLHCINKTHEPVVPVAPEVVPAPVVVAEVPAPVVEPAVVDAPAEVEALWPTQELLPVQVMFQ